MTNPALNRVAIIDSVRIPFSRAHTCFQKSSNKEMLNAVVRAIVDRHNLQGCRLGEVAAGATFKHSRDWNLTREAILDSGLDPHTPAFDLQRACGTSLSASIMVANKIALGQIEVGIAGGVDSISDLPLEYHDKFRHAVLRAGSAKTAWGRIKPFFSIRPRHLKPQVPGVTEPHTGLSMGQSCEQMARRWGITREAQDELALASHNKAARAWETGFYQSLVIPFLETHRDNTIRPDTSMQKLAALKAVFADDNDATLTAGNSSPLTDGASGVLLASENWAKSRDLPIMAYLTANEVGAVDFVSGKDGLLMAPAYAVSRMLTRMDLGFADFDFFEIHEAFAAQVLCTLKAWDDLDYCKEKLNLRSRLGQIDQSRLNVKGGSIALGHPFGATGTRIVGTMAKLLMEKGHGRGLISICTGGGMGVCAVLER